MTRTIVVGAGLAGLSCAHTLARAGQDVLLLEASPRAGGVVGTIAEDGFRFETGPHTVPASSATFCAVADELALTPRLQACASAARVRLVFHRGRPVALPASPLAFFRSPLLSWRAKLRLLAEPFRRCPLHPPGEPEPTLAEFLTERIGAEPTRRLAGAFVRGIYAGDIDGLGARSAFPRMWQVAQDHGGLARGLLARARARKRSHAPSSDPSAAARPDAATSSAPGRPALQHPAGTLLGFPEGMRVFVDALAASLGERLRTRAPVRALARRAAGWEVQLDGDERLPARSVVLAVPAPAAADLLRDERGDGAASDALRAIAYADLTLFHGGYDEHALPGLPHAFGCLVPPEESAREDAPDFLGVLFPTRLFPDRAPAGQQVVSCFYRTSALGVDPQATVARDLRLLLGTETVGEPRVHRFLQWERAIPQYAPGHDERLADIEDELGHTHGGVYLAGSHIGGVSVDAVLSRGRVVAERILHAQR